ncbi:MAG: hypothetical protein LBD78_06145 [Spirochaetaceae bacterium]|nr:hypothetical protein [Spirochaetaceae bacterium]
MDYITKLFVREILLARIKIHLKNSMTLRRLRKQGGVRRKRNPSLPLPPGNGRSPFWRSGG